MWHFENWRYGFLTWKDMYNSIKNVNTLLSNIDNVPVSNSDEEQLLEQIKSEAIFIRAFNYTNLLRSYGGVVLVDKKFELTDDFKEQKRASLQRSEEHTSELQSRGHLVCRLLLEKKKTTTQDDNIKKAK